MNSTISFIVKTCEGRESYLPHLQDNIPELIISRDDFTYDPFNHTANKNFVKALRLANDGPTIQMEDDIILCDDFVGKVAQEIRVRPNEVIQFFSMRKADLTVGSRYEPGSKFLMAQCFYLPSGIAEDAANFCEKLGNEKFEYGGHLDLGLAAYMKSKKMRYWVVVPNLVDHIVGKSAIDRRRSSKRTSLTFR